MKSRALLKKAVVLVPVGSVVALAGTLMVGQARSALPPVPVPVENPITEAKRVLGKVLFFDEQLSSSGTVACATCHVPGRAGADPRVARGPGLDGTLNTPDDVFGSPGVIMSDANEDYQRHSVFAFNPQITGRAANVTINAAYAPELFWDGRAGGTFRDPLTNAVVIASGGALESQAAGPPTSDVEMAHAAIDWTKVASRIASVNPMDLATAAPPDVAAALAGRPSYPALFEAAFGDPAVTPARIAMALATFQRTLIADQTPWDAFVAGNATALNAQQQRGWNAFQGAAQCNVCHTAPLFTNNTFRNIGLRPIPEDSGRQAITGLASDAGRFKTPTLRNVGLKASFMHTGQFTNLAPVMGFYAAAPGVPAGAPTRVNRDPAMNAIVLPPPVSADIQAFIATGLTDPRVANQQFPFDKPTLFTERPADRATLQGGGVAGLGGIQPGIIVQDPPMVGNAEYRVGLFNARGGSTARLAVSTSNTLTAGRITPARFLTTMTVPGTGAGNGVATLNWKLLSSQVAGGQVLFAQWFVDDPAAPGGLAASPVARIPFFCGSYGCPTAPCTNADIARTDGTEVPDGQVDNGDFAAFFAAFFGGTTDSTQWPVSASDIAATDGAPGADGRVDNGDFSLFFTSFFVSCP